MRSPRWIWNMGAPTAIVLLLVACSTTDFVTGQPTRNMYLLDEDIELGSEVLQEILTEMEDSDVPVNRDKRRLKKLRSMVERIAAVSHMPDLPYEVHLLETNVVNAMCAPGGKVIVFSGLYDRKHGLALDEDEVAAVIGHEIAHATCRHTTEELTRAAPVNTILAIAGLIAEADENEDATAIISAAFLLYNGLWLPRYSRQDEAEADRVGLMYMAQAGYDPRAAIRVWKRAHEKEGSDPDLFVIFSSHPTHAYRAQHLQEHLPEALAAYAETQGLTVDQLESSGPSKPF